MGEMNNYKKFSDLGELYLINRSNYKTHIGRLRQYEIMYGRDFFEFSEKQMYDCLFKIYTKDLSKRSIGQYASAHKRYLEWLVKEKNVKINYNYDEVISLVKEEAINNIKKYTFLDRDKFYSSLFNINDSRIAIILGLLFEGIGSDSNNTEIMKIKLSDITEDRINFSETKILTFPKEIIELITINQKENKKSYNEDEYLIKSYKDINRNNSQIVRQALSKAKKYNRYFKIDEIKNSGKCFYLNLIEKDNGYLKKDDYIRVMKKYDMAIYNNNSYCELKRMYTQYVEDDKINRNYTIENFETILREIYDISVTKKELYSLENENDDGILEQSKPDEELGKFGEEWFHKYLEKTFEKEKFVIVDQTLNKVGYDFSVFKNEEEMYEVKSTRNLQDASCFFMTMKEMKTAYINKDNYKLVILNFDIDNRIKSMYIIPNPIICLELEKNVISFIEMIKEKKSIPIEIKIFYNNSKLKEFMHNI